jgi:predicted Kef-type K+ transport protein
VVQDNAIVDWEIGFIIVAQFDTHSYIGLSIMVVCIQGMNFCYILTQLAVVIGFLCHNNKLVRLNAMIIPP